MNLRNVAIIAHVDHGKTTLVDKLLEQSNIITKESINIVKKSMDSNQLEKERGITILAKTTSLTYKDYKINILDTPGHADFGGEVERIMKMVDGVILLIDAKDGVMPQTKFVLRKALENNLKPIVVVNKVDRPFCEPRRVVNEVFDLFIDLNATEEQIEFPIIYASGLLGMASFVDDNLESAKSLKPILDTIINYVEPPKISIGALQFQCALIEYNDFIGRMGIGKVVRGTLNVNETVSIIRLDGKIEHFRVQKIFSYVGLNRVEITVAEAGDIVGVAGLSNIGVGETITTIGNEEALPPLYIDEPTVQMLFLTNNSPFLGLEGKNVTASKLEDRLYKETQKDVSLTVTRETGQEAWVVHGRGELHLGILIETIRREDFEFQVSRPKVILKIINDVTCEPYEEAQIDTPNDYVGAVMDLIGSRKAELVKMSTVGNNTRLIYIIPSRGLIGLTTNFLTITKGFGVLTHMFYEYRPYVEQKIGLRSNGVLIANGQGISTFYALSKLEERGTLFIEPRQNVYEGMIVGENNKDNDLVVNVIVEKQLTNVRSATKEATTTLKKQKIMSLEDCLGYINDDELVEITPKNIRLRKLYLKPHERKNAAYQS